jgi:hypothetical protein
MQIFTVLITLLVTPIFAQTNPASTPPVQFVNGGILQINNNERTEQPTPAYSATPTFHPNPVLPQQQQVLPLSTPANLPTGGF